MINLQARLLATIRYDTIRIRYAAPMHEGRLMLYAEKLRVSSLVYRQNRKLT